MQKIPNAKREDGTSLYRPIEFSHKIVRCTNPQSAWLPANGGRISFSYIASGKAIQMNCGSCVFCRLQHAREWALRCTHEAYSFQRNSFLTLTYANEHVPLSDNGLQTLVRKHAQDFLKRLRKKLSNNDIKIRYFGCGEYGEKLSRPHFHFIIFGYDFPDKKVLRATRNQAFPLYSSEELSECWPFGHSSIGAFSYESAAYVARYVVKKVKGDAKAHHYDDRLPEFVMMSTGGSRIDKATGELIRTGGLGYEWYREFGEDMYSRDYCTLRGGASCSVPRYYDKLLKLDSEERYDAVKSARVARAENKTVYPAIDVGVLSRAEEARITLFKNAMRRFENA